MMVLAIDAGNSRIKWGVADDSGWLRRDALNTADAAQIGEAIKDLPVPRHIVISNVAGNVVRDALTLALAPLNVAPTWVQGRAEQCGVKSGYADPAQLGSDRWAGVIAAWRRFGATGAACIVVNAGTTMTVDALSSDGVFLGGVIVPGLELMRESLTRGTAQLKHAPGVFCYFPDSTADAIMSGAINALAGAIERMRAYMHETGQGAPLIVLSGGAALLIEPRLNAPHELVDNLVLEGLLDIARESI
ncbi:MAG: type III pantothenate kinase [Betaproteobacteria bacterium]|nr:type III pantothenate kinase [Betaproteobacteria bacterium]